LDGGGSEDLDVAGPSAALTVGVSRKLERSDHIALRHSCSRRGSEDSKRAIRSMSLDMTMPTASSGPSGSASSTET
jgi:hypothetical protein